MITRRAALAASSPTLLVGVLIWNLWDHRGQLVDRPVRMVCTTRG